MEFERYPESGFRYLTRADVIEAARDVDIVEAVREALLAHSAGQTILPAEAHLAWTTADGFAARCLAMPGAVLGGRVPVVGLKTINASLGNPGRGILRSQGFTVLLDAETARPVALMEAAYISAMRTAAVAVISVRHLAAGDPQVLALIGCGALAQAHVALLLRSVPTLKKVALFDTVPDRARQLARHVEDRSSHHPGVSVTIAGNARECVTDADLVVPVTTVTSGYLEPDWLKPGALVVHVSLDDLTEAAVLRADAVVVDDWTLVSEDPRRLLGRMYRAGTLLDPHGDPRPGVIARPHARRVDATLGDVLAGRHPGRRGDSDIVISNPFGMAILDVAVADRINARAGARGIGTLLNLGH